LRGKAESERGGGQSVASIGKLGQTRIVKLAAKLGIDVVGADGLLRGADAVEGGAFSEALVFSPASSIYGARAANGVILVTTQRGRPGEMRFEYSGYTGMQEPSKHIALLTADEFARMYMRNPNRD
jgi:hypothetical protein